MTSPRSDVTEVLAQARWAEEGSYLGEVVKSGKFPILVKVARGQYQNLGQGSFTSQNVVSHLLLYSAGRHQGIAAQCVKVKGQGGKVTPFGPTLSIPRSYDGHFEILSEDGKCISPISNVETLLQKFPDSCLVREPIKAYRPVTETGSDVIGSSNGGISDKTRVIPSGEVLVLVGEVSVPCGRNKVNRYLRCFDSNGQTVYLNLSQKGKFSPLARHDSISGVHTTKNILKKRMPMMVRVVDGKPPVAPPTKSTSFKFVPELRLLCTLEEELIFAMPLSQNKDCWLIPLPLSVPLKFQLCRNMEEVDETKEFCRLYEKLKTMTDQAKNLIQIYDINLKKELRFDGRQWKAYTPPIYLSSSTPLLASSNDPVILTSPDPLGHNYEIPDVTDYEDIDEIYDYVRGVKPQPQTILQPQPVTGNTTLITVSLGNADPDSVMPIRIDDRPEPPPIETIPTHKVKVIDGSKVKGGRHVTMVMTGNHHYHAPVHQLGSNGSSPLNTSSTSAGSGEELDMRGAKKKQLFVKRRSGSQNNLLEGQGVKGQGVTGGISGSPSNRILFRRSPIFDFRYKSMNDLNRSSLESRASSGQGQGHGFSNIVRYFQSQPSGGYNSNYHHNHNHHRLSSSNLLAQAQRSQGAQAHLIGSARNKGIFRPKSLTNILSMEDVHLPLPPSPTSPIDAFQKVRRKSQHGKLYL